MDSPIRQQQKRNDYQRHKLFRKMARRKKAKKEQEQKIAEKELRRKLRIPKYEDGKPTDTTWMSNWLTKRADKIQENMGDIPSETFDRFNTATAQQQLQNLQGTVQKTVQEVENKAGVGKFNGRTDIKSNPRTITIAADAPAQTVVHEQTHALASPAFGGMEDSLPQHQKISQIYKEDGVHSVAPTTTKDGRVIPPDIRAQLEKYINSPEEIYGRLNELRYGLGLNPTYIVTPEDVQKWRAAGKFDRFWRDVPDSTILRLFNEVAQQAVPIRDDGVYVAKDGKGAYGNMKKLKQPRYADGKPENTYTWYYDKHGNYKQPTVDENGNVQQTIQLGDGVEVTPNKNLINYIRNAFRNVDRDTYLRLLEETYNMAPVYKVGNNPKRSTIYMSPTGRMYDINGSTKVIDHYALGGGYLDDEDPNKRIFRLAQLTQASGNPYVYMVTERNKNDHNWNEDNYRASYNLRNHIMHLGDPNEFPDSKSILHQYIPELAHAYQFHGPGWKWRKDNLHKRNREPANNDTRYENFGHGYLNGYENPRNVEFQAHSVIEPAMWDFFENSLSREQFDKDVKKQINTFDQEYKKYPMIPAKTSAYSNKYNFLQKIAPNTVEYIWTMGL